jgi:hypothetical protein
MILLTRISYFVKHIACFASCLTIRHAPFPGQARALMFHVFLLLISAGVLQLPVFAGGNSDPISLPSSFVSLKPELVPAMEILARVRANLPQKALRIKGQILSGGRIGKLEHTGYVEMFLDFGGDPAMVCYKISDAFGTPLEQMTISMAEESDPELEYERLKSPRPAAAPEPAGIIMNTDLTWNDLSLLFLWRTDGRTQRTENLRGRECYVIVFPLNGNGEQSVWIDTQMLVLIQMEEVGADGRLLRRLMVKNIKQISDQWMIKNLEIRAYPSLHHTLIKIDEVFTLE